MIGPVVADIVPDNLWDSISIVLLPDNPTTLPSIHTFRLINFALDDKAPSKYALSVPETVIILHFLHHFF